MAATWNKQMMVEKMAFEADISKSKAQKALDAMLNGVEEALKSGERVTLTGFGTFKTSERKGRMGRNPQTGERMYIPARRVARFTPGKPLKESVAESAVSEPAPVTSDW